MSFKLHKYSMGSKQKFTIHAYSYYRRTLLEYLFLNVEMLIQTLFSIGNKITLQYHY